MIQRRKWLLASAASSFFLAHHTLVKSAPAIPKLARILVGFPPGGSADLVARPLSQNLTGYASRVIVDNKPGAGGRIALEALKNSEADGSSMAVTPSSMVSIYPHVYKRLTYDPLVDFTPVAKLGAFSFVLVVGPVVPQNVKTLADLLDWCKANPSQAAYATPGSGTAPHFVGVTLARDSGVDLLHVPYKGGAQAMTEVIGGQIAINIAVISNALPHIRAGKVRAITMTGGARNSALPDVPTVSESGYPDVQAVEWFGTYLPRGVDPDLVARLNALILEAVKTKAVQDVLTANAFESVAPMTPAEFAREARADMERWRRVVQASGFTPED